MTWRKKCRIAGVWIFGAGIIFDDWFLPINGMPAALVEISMPVMGGGLILIIISNLFKK